MVIEKNAPALRQRNYGIDLLRIISMLMVVTLHVLGPGGILFMVERFSPNYLAALFLEMMFFCAINCYGLISGYVGINSTYRYTNLFMIYLQVVCYTLPITFIMNLKNPDFITMQDFLKAVFPITGGQYWYLTAYAGLFLMMPLLNKGISALTKNQHRAVCVTLFATLSLLPSIRNADIFITGWGYGMLWLAFLYIVGAYVKNHGFFIKKGWVLFAGYMLCTVINYVVKLYMQYTSPLGKFADFTDSLLTNYTSPTMLLSGLCLFVMFSRLKTNKPLTKLISIFAPCSFGVYILHVQPNIWNKIISYKYTSYLGLSPAAMLGAVLLTALVIYTVLSLVELVRIKAFNLLKIKKACLKIENRLFGKLWQE